MKVSMFHTGGMHGYNKSLMLHKIASDFMFSNSFMQSASILINLQ